MQFEKQMQHCLRNICIQQQTQEQTQDVRLPDGYPDIGKIVSCWGQVLIRGKEWRGDSIGISGGTMVWILYAAEDGSGLQSLECWIPFQIRMDIPNTEHDGFICACPRLQSVDARSTSARKMMVRSIVSLGVRVLEEKDMQIPVPPQKQEDIEILTMDYPMELAREYGEKQITLEEELMEDDQPMQLGKLLHYSLEPVLSEQKVMAGRLVFRGTAKLNMLCENQNGQLEHKEMGIPFSQYAELDREYGSNSTAWITFMVTGLELDRDNEDHWTLKGTVSAQYEVYERVMIPLAEDAYSLHQQVTPQQQTLQLPVCLDRCEETVHGEQTVAAASSRIIETVCSVGQPLCRQAGDTVQVELPGSLQVLFYDEQGAVCGAQGKFSEQWTVCSDPGNQIWTESICNSICTFSDGDGLRCQLELKVRACVSTERGMETVESLQIGQKIQPDPSRPSMILCRAGGRRLWDIAKSCGSTVEDIRRANKLQQEPADQQMLLIPVQ